MLHHTYYMGLGGAKWWGLKDHLKGIGLPKGKEYLKNQWLPYRLSGFHPHYTVLWIGSNDVDDLDTLTKHVWFTTEDPSQRREKVVNVMNEWFDALTPLIDEFLLELTFRIPGCVIKYIPIFPRPWWSPYAHRFAHSLDKYILLKAGRDYRIRSLPVRRLFSHYKQIPIIKDLRDIVHPGLTEQDDTHLSSWGYQIFVLNMMSPLLHNFHDIREEVQISENMWEEMAGGNGL